MQTATPSPSTSISMDSLAVFEEQGLSESTVSASQLYAQSLFADLMRQAGKRRGKHNAARALRARAKQRKRKAKRKA